MNILTDIVWTEIYRPSKVADCILPSNLKKLFQTYVDAGEIPTLLLYGSHGTGKTSVALAMCKELQLSYFFTNGSLDRGIDIVRTEIIPFVSTIALNGKRKVVIVDEADNSTPDYQLALKALIEEYSKNCSFIFTANHPKKLIEPLQSRCVDIEFRIPSDETVQMKLEMYRNLKVILIKEGIEYESKALHEIIAKYFPDYRKIVGVTQKFARTSTLTQAAVLGAFGAKDFIPLYTAMKKKDFRSVRQWIVDNVDMSNPTEFYSLLYSNMKVYLLPESIPNAVELLAEYQFKAAFVSNQEINIMACITGLMKNCEFL
jgi:replication factor C small subunit